MTIEQPSYLEIIADDIYRATHPADDDWLEDEDPLWLGYAVLCLAKGTGTTSADVHDAWAAWAIVDYKGGHHSIIPFDQLAPEIQAYDDLYRDAIHTVARAMVTI